MTETTSCSAWIDNLFDSIRNCLGWDKSASSTIFENGVKNEVITAQPLLHDDFLSSSINDMEHDYANNGDCNLEQSFESISISSDFSVNQNGEGSSNDPSEFVNRGLLLWNKTRKEWIQSEKRLKKSREFETRISWNATYENLLGSNRPFRRPIPLTEMVDFLVDVWEQEGLYDS